MDFGGSFTLACLLKVILSTLKLLNSTIIGFWWLFYYALSSEIIVSTLKLLNTTIIGFWWLFCYALSTENLVSTLKLLNISIIGFWWLFYYALSSEIIVSTLKLLNSTIIGFWWLFYYGLVILNHRVYFETFKHYYYWILVGSFTHALSSEIIVSTLKHLNSTIVGFWWLFYYGLSSESLLSTLKILNSKRATIIGFCGSFTMPCRLKSSCLLWNF